IARVRRVFDLGADVARIGAHLAQDPLLAPRIAARPGLRAPGGWDGFELAARAVLGAEVSVAAARRQAGELVRRAGAAVALGPGLTRVFPTAAQLVAADLRTLDLPAARKAALVAVARAACDDPRLFDGAGALDETIARLSAIPGVRDGTAHCIALCAGEPDAFPAGDATLLRRTRLGAAALPARP